MSVFSKKEDVEFLLPAEDCDKILDKQKGTQNDLEVNMIVLEE